MRTRDMGRLRCDCDMVQSSEIPKRTCRGCPAPKRLDLTPGIFEALRCWPKDGERKNASLSTVVISRIPLVMNPDGTARSVPYQIVNLIVKKGLAVKQGHAKLKLTELGKRKRMESIRMKSDFDHIGGTKDESPMSRSERAIIERLVRICGSWPGSLYIHEFDGQICVMRKNRDGDKIPDRLHVAKILEFQSGKE